jgi:hypothetical protein
MALDSKSFNKELFTFKLLCKIAKVTVLTRQRKLLKILSNI